VINFANYRTNNKDGGSYWRPVVPQLIKKFRAFYESGGEIQSYVHITCPAYKTYDVRSCVKLMDKYVLGVGYGYLLTRPRLIICHSHIVRGRGSPVEIGTGYGLDGRGSIPSCARLFSSPQHPNRLWGLSSSLSNGYRWLFLQG
jgi:hypothetical protein